MKIARVFPRKTKATPDDSLAFANCSPPTSLPEIDEVHISVTFTYDMRRAEELEREWRVIGVPVKMGGAAFNQPSGEFVPGMYLKQGYTITSRGCPNRCWFCNVWKREGNLRELEIKSGWNICDDNLLACSDQHINAVFDMLKTQKERAVFSGGFEAKRLKPWHLERLRELNPARIYFAYDTPDDYEPLVEAGKLLRQYRFNIRQCCCYVLIGYPQDTFEKAEKRLVDAMKAGFWTFAMLYKDEQGFEDLQWRRFQREWCNATIVGVKLKELENKRNLIV